ncbi:hypothetical protein CPC08DRAFT_716146 [Agrocybe pediades]|nr:hypothetical protein CPC08DRAFT_716146 [Agrocybe pediades]
MTQTVDNTLGAGFVGDVLASILFGLSCIQSYYYFINYPKDSLRQKSVVVVLMIANAIQLAISSHGMYYHLISEFHNNSALSHIVWSFKLQMAFDVFIAVSVQALYALKVLNLGGYVSRRWHLFVLFCVVVGAVLGIVFVVEVYRLSGWEDVKAISWSIAASFAVSAAIDIALAVSLCIYLKGARASFSANNPENRFKVALHYALISGCFTSIFALTAFATYLAMPGNLVFFAITLLSNKLYVNSYIAMLNSRAVNHTPHGTTGSVPLEGPGSGAARVGGAASLVQLRKLKSHPVREVRSPSALESQKSEQQMSQHSIAGFDSKAKFIDEEDVMSSER